MSYSGYTQFLCGRGHEFSLDCYEEDDGNPRCPHCGARPVWRNGVDTMNGSWEVDEVTGEEVRIDGHVDLEVNRPAEFCECPRCGDSHVCKWATYKVPAKGIGHVIG
jgi:hypothetical protein